ncbi:Lnb N-terminal periplasmic domain-containing protein [Lunatibacter salilacus]|uniref:Lnb N-terminal periplasmic domain-containing protein n=1 Tax=Lunatibacter salilacus TaxID=2483804 RepID=UPI00131CEBAB|nr:DUF4105 domain-containing protein [Lunatibacter salilacus]
MRTIFPYFPKIRTNFLLLWAVFIIGFLSIPQAHAQTYQISLITCDPGDELYSTFGHSAIRVLDTDSGRDLVFNYGTFDFNTPFFYVKFTRRTLDYQLALTTFDQFLYEYNYFKRSVWEQVLDLNPEQTAAIIDFLRTNYEPENRKYRYDFFYDNCSTRIRNLMETLLGENLKWNEPDTSEAKTFRDLIDEYVYPLPWSDLGIDLALGAVIDQNATEREKLFLPDYLSAAFGRASVVGDGPSRPLVREENIIYDFPEREGNINFLLSPYFLFWMLAILFGVFTFVGFKRKRLYLGLDIALLGAMGVLGILVVYLWFFTAHSQTKSNWNILWAFPLHFVGIYGLLTGKRWVRNYLLGALILADLALVIWIFGIQSFHPSILPLLLAVILRTNFLYYHVDKWKPEKASG